MQPPFDRPAAVLVAYLVITIVMTWPVIVGLDDSLPGDLGDPAFVAGVLAWGSEHWLALFTGDLGAAARFWNLPIFHPEPLATAYSEHFALHALVTLPLYAITRNAILCYNVWFLATFVVGAFGMYLLVRDLTERPAAAFVAGLAFAFAPYRIASLGHLQVLSSHWMPFVMLGFRRYFSTGNSNALLGAAAALWAQNLSSGYYMLFFGPFVALYVLAEMWTRRLLRTLAVWRDVLISAVVATAATAPFMMPYVTRHRGFVRPIAELELYSADLLGWLTASPAMTVWGDLQTFPKSEGSLFPGLTIIALAALGLGRCWVRNEAALPPGERQSRRVVALFATLALVVSFWLSLGPMIQIATHTQPFPSLYRWAWEYLPGWNAARVPARFAMIAVFALAILAGMGASVFDAPRRRWLLATAGALLLIEGAAFPLPQNVTFTSANGFVPPDSLVFRLNDGPPVYRYLRRLDKASVVAHFPFGLPEREIQYGYYAALHGRRIVNGYSGSFPLSYSVRLPILRNPLADPQSTRVHLDTDRVSHIVVHAGAWMGDEGMRLVSMLEGGGWRRAAQFDRDYVLQRSSGSDR